MNKSNIDWVKNQSQTIDILRFPMIICVIFIHMVPNTTSLLNADFPLLSSHGIYNLIEITFSHMAERIAVPIFFFFSGYLFFANFKTWSWNLYHKKIKSRVKTLFIPYILWNIIPILLSCISFYIINKATPDFLSYIRQISPVNLIGEYTHDGTNILGLPIYTYYPQNFPLWFLRDLIVVSALTPIIYYLIKKLKMTIVIIFAIGFILNIRIPIPGLSFTALCFFSLGAYFAIFGKNFVYFSQKHIKITAPISLITLIFGIYFGGNSDTIGNIICSFYILFTIFTTFAIFSYFIERFQIKPCQILVRSCFFIYATHVIGILILETPLSFSSKLLSRYIIGSETYWQQCASYFFTPFLTAGICLLCYYILRRFAPKLCGVLCGNR